MENQRFSGLMISQIFKQRTVYIQPSKVLLQMESSDSDIDTSRNANKEQPLPEATVHNLTETIVIEESFLQFIDQATTSEEHVIFLFVEESIGNCIVNNPDTATTLPTATGKTNSIYQTTENQATNSTASQYEKNYNFSVFKCVGASTHKTKNKQFKKGHHSIRRHYT
ncbi:UNVERIFIED_CONTAM: hypothetical protein FKN15_024783 [Acipenser sinensis]